MITAYERLLEQLDVVRTNGGKHAMARCPAHEDRQASLSITKIEGGVLLYDHGGCDTSDVLASVKLTLADLWDDPRGATYRYDDGRTVHRTPDKEFKQSGTNGARPTLYRLSKVSQAVGDGVTVYLVEGEKDVHALESLGLVATTAPMGARNFDKVDVSPLTGARVIAIPDRDQAGQIWARQVRDQLDGVAAELIYKLAAVGKDAADHIAAELTVDDLVDAEPPTDQDDHDAAHEFYVQDELRKLRVRADARAIFDRDRRPPLPPFDAGTLGEVLARPPEPKARIDQLMPWQGGTLITAQRKVGKTTFVGNLCRSLITGYDFLDRFEVRRVDGMVAVLNYEMPAQTLARWLVNMGVPHDQLFLINLRARANPLASLEDRAMLADLLRGRGTESIIVDPFGRAYTGKSQNDPGEVGAWLSDLDRFTRGEVGAKDLVLLAHHGWEQERTRGASSLEDWADTIITLAKDGEDRYIRAMGRDVDLEEDQLIWNAAQRRLTLAGTGSRKATKDARTNQVLRTGVLKIIREMPGISGSAISVELRDRGIPHQRDSHRPLLKDLVESGELIFRVGARKAKLYSINPDPPTSPDIPQPG